MKEKVGNSRRSLIGIWNCRVAGSCSVVCPRNVDPSLAIQRLKEMSIK